MHYKLVKIIKSKVAKELPPTSTFSQPHCYWLMPTNTNSRAQNLNSNIENYQATTQIIIEQNK